MTFFLGAFFISALYSSVGHAGASGYIALFTLLGMQATEIRWLALALNLLVSAITAAQFVRAGHLSRARLKSLAIPLLLGSLPFAFAGGALRVPSGALKAALGVVLLFSAARFLWNPSERRPSPPPGKLALVGVGALLGLFAGMTGTGGGIFLSPLLLVTGWGATLETAAISALFILGNSASALLGGLVLGRPGEVLGVLWGDAGRTAALMAGVAIGGALGSHLGSRRFSSRTVRRVLSVTLLLAAGKLLFGA